MTTVGDAWEAGENEVERFTEGGHEFAVYEHRSGLIMPGQLRFWTINLVGTTRGRLLNAPGDAREMAQVILKEAA